MRARLSSLRIAGYRQLREVQAEGLADVNLIVGANNAGKTTLLEALRIFAAGGAPSVLAELLARHGQTLVASNIDSGDDNARALASLFHGRTFPQLDEEGISIGSADGSLRVTIEHVFQVEVEEARDFGGTTEKVLTRKRASKSALPPGSDLIEAIEIRAAESFSLSLMLDEFGPGASSMRRLRFAELAVLAPASEVPFSPLPSARLAQVWDEIVLTDQEAAVLEALRLLEPQIQGLAFTQTRRPSDSRHAMIKLSGEAVPVPLRSMGDGMYRVLQLVLSAIKARAGFLLIDEFESGLHYAVQGKVWKLLFDLARSNDMQIFATTHSSDCVQAFAEVAQAHPSQGALLRMERDAETGESALSVVAEDGLAALVAADVEVR